MVAGLAFSPDGNRLASASFDRTVMVWDMTVDSRSGVVAPLQTLIGHTSVVHGVAFSPDGSQIASASFDRSVRVWDAVTGQETLTLTGHTDGANDVAFSPDGTRLASPGRDETVKFWDPTPRQGVFPVKSQTKINILFGVAFSPDGNRLASAGSDQTVKILDAVTGQEIRTLSSPGATYSFNPRSFGQVAFSPDGSRMAEVCENRADNAVKIWDVMSGQLIHTLTGHTGGVWSVAFSPDARPRRSLPASIEQSKKRSARYRRLPPRAAVRLLDSAPGTQFDGPGRV